MGWFSGKNNAVVEHALNIEKDKKKVDEIPTSDPVVGYVDAELRITGAVYRYYFKQEINDKSETFFYHSPNLSNVDTRFLEENQNMIIEIILGGIVLKDYGEINDHGNKYKYASNNNVYTQFILICESCKNIPLFPNSIIGFYAPTDSLKFTCEDCAKQHGTEYHDIKNLKQNFPEHEKIRLVLNKKDFSPTILKTNTVAVNRPMITRVNLESLPTIKTGQENDLRTIVEYENILEKDTKNDDLSTETVLGNLSRKDRENELDIVLEELNNKSDSTVGKVFE